MSLEKHHGGWIIALSFGFSFVLAIMPLPSWAIEWRPDWVTMILIYWCIALPQRVGIMTGWLVGIIQDVLHDTLLGYHALSMSLIAYISVRFHRRFRIFPWWQQVISIFVMVAAIHLPDIWVYGILQQRPVDWNFLYPAISSMILWQWVFVILRDIRRTYKVS